MKMFFSVLIACFIFSCSSKDLSCSEYPLEIKTKSQKQLYDEAKWQIYKFNLIKGDGYDIDNPFYQDSTYVKTSLSEFELDFHKIEALEDTTSFYFFFERGISPDSGPYYYSASFWGNKIYFGLNFYERFGFTHKREDFSKEFEKYLLEHQGMLSDFLICEAKKRGIQFDSD